MRVPPKLHKFLQKFPTKRGRLSQWCIFVHAVSNDSSRDVLGSGTGLFLPISQSLHAHLLCTAEAALQSGQEIIVEGEFWKLMNDVVDGGFEIGITMSFYKAIREISNRFN